ncbi:alkaline phosphatase family protein [Acidobacteria bacterium AH-259-D05]|nr:alkaline phosphatase family protein [Acidobacteria bacterium AH-259-D05]
MKNLRHSVSPLIFSVCLLILSAFAFSQSSGKPSDEFSLPQLVVVIIVDGLPQEQLTKYFDQLTEQGFKFLLEKGAWFTNAHYSHSTTFTAVGHATILTGAHPYRHGLIGNDWLDSETQTRVYSVEDPAHVYLGEATGDQAGTSPRNLRVTTVGDELLLANGFSSRVLSISGKDRGAILPAGKFGTAYFHSSKSGRFVTTTYYMEKYPRWWKKFDSGQPQDRWFGKSWEPLLLPQAYSRSAADGRPQHVDYNGLGKKFPHRVTGGLDGPGPAYYSALLRTPFGNDYTLAFVKAALQGEGLGKNPNNVPDILVVSFSSQDYVTHLFGPESKQAHDHFLRLDRTLAKFFSFLDEWVGLSNTLMMLTADHGFAHTPEWCQEHGLEAGRIDPTEMIKELNQSLSLRFGPGIYAISWFNPTIYLDREMIEDNQLNPSQVESAAADFLLNYPGIEIVFTKTQIENGQIPITPMARQVMLSWDPHRSGDLFVVQRTCWYLLGQPHAFASTHGSPHSYDTHVPLLFLGRWFRPGKYGNNAEIVDIAPTLAHILNVRLPSGNEGRVLVEILK